jgi:hypothetical protein
VKKKRFIKCNGTKLCAYRWYLESGLDPATIIKRVDRGWNPCRAVTEPVADGYKERTRKRMATLRARRYRVPGKKQRRVIG